jgi:hypothetical protein
MTSMKMLVGSVLLAIVIYGFGVTALAGPIIPDTEALKYAGHGVTVEGTVAKVFKSKNGNVFLNFGGAYPNETFVAWIPADAPEAADSGFLSLQGKKVKISGTIQLYRDKPEIKVTTKDQIVVE